MKMEADIKIRCQKCGVGRPYNPTYKIEGYCPGCQTYDLADKYLNGYRMHK